MDIGSAGSDEALQDLRAYVTVVDETEFEKGLDHFYAHHDFPESLFDAVQRMQAHRGASPRQFDLESRQSTPDHRQRVGMAHARMDTPQNVLDEPSAMLDSKKRGGMVGPIVGVVIVAMIGIGFLLTRGGDADPSASTTADEVPAAEVTVPQATDEVVADSAPTVVQSTGSATPPLTVEATDPPANAVVELPAPLFIVLSDESQYAVWGLEDPDGTVTYVLRSPARQEGCLLISYGGNDVDALGDCTIAQIGTSQPANILYSADDGSVLIELRNPSVVNLTDEVGFAQSAVVDVLQAPVVERSGSLNAFGGEYSAASQ
ncbi:MAG: hypothetical protein GY926_05640 [bacterium]|nr:hypothetical protein [bacterium]